MSIKSRIATAVSLHYLVWLALFVVVLALGFAAVGLDLLLVPQLGAPAAAFVTGGALLGLLVVCALVAWITMRIRGRARHGTTRHDNEPHSASEDFIEQQLRPIIGERATVWARANPGLLAVGALSAGVALAASPVLRRTLFMTARPILIRKGLSAITSRDDD